MKKKNVRNRNSMNEVSIVYKRPLLDEMPNVKSSIDADEILKNVIDLDTLDYKEFFWVLLLNNCNSVLGFAEIGKGDTKGVIVNVKEIFQLTLTSNATSIILCHNHPSGKLKASISDKNITSKVKEIAELFSVTLLDHLILTSESYYSFADNGIL